PWQRYCSLTASALRNMLPQSCNSSMGRIWLRRFKGSTAEFSFFSRSVGNMLAIAMTAFVGSSTATKQLRYEMEYRGLAVATVRKPVGGEVESGRRTKTRKDRRPQAI